LNQEQKNRESELDGERRGSKQKHGEEDEESVLVAIEDRTTVLASQVFQKWPHGLALGSDGRSLARLTMAAAAAWKATSTRTTADTFIFSQKWRCEGLASFFAGDLAISRSTQSLCCVCV